VLVFDVTDECLEWEYFLEVAAAMEVAIQAEIRE